MTKILLVEDDELSRDMLARLLARRGYKTLVAINGRQAVALAKSETPDLILMDLSMPVMDGWAAAQTLKADPDTAAIPIIGVTANALAGDRENALRAGCDDYDTKPIDFNRLLIKIEAFLQKGTP
jgi:CheY-like chemotaxis protein